MAVDGKAIEEKVKGRVKEEASITEDKEEDPITPEFINECLLANERGDGALFAALHRGGFVFNKTSAQWLRYTGHHWETDIMEDAHKCVEAATLKYVEEGEALYKAITDAKSNNKDGRAERLTKKQEAFFKRARRLRSVAGGANCLIQSHRVEDGLGVRGEDLDRRPQLLACHNGVVELDTGKFRPGAPDDYLVKAVPHDWVDYDAEAPTWERFLKDVFKDDDELISYVRRLFGYGITGLTVEHVFPVLHGEGRNGKGTLVEVLSYILGDLAAPIQSEMLLDQRAARSSAGPTPDIMALKGRRVVFASETDEGRRVSPARVKWLTGGDTLVGRNPHDKYETKFEPTHLLCMLTNHLPHAPGDDYAFWQRAHLVPFLVKFVDSPSAEDERTKDKHLSEKLRAEAPGILAWVVRGCIEWRQQGLNPPQTVLSETERYRLSEDLAADFLSECCEPLDKTDHDEYRIQYADLYKVFIAW